MKSILLLCSLGLLLLNSGCTSVNYSRVESSGEKINFSVSSFVTRKQIKDVEYSVNPAGTRKFLLKGYSDNQTEVVTAAITAALEAYMRQLPAPTNSSAR